MRRSGTDVAVVEPARFILATRSLNAGYEKADGVPCWVARLRPGGWVTWNLRPPAPELTAA